MGAVLRFKYGQIPRQREERVRLKVVQGLDHGATFVVTQDRVTLGRGEDCDVVLSDIKASRRHAEILSSGQGWAVRDLGSANGIIFNGVSVKNAVIKTGDTIGIGDTTLEFLAAEAATGMLAAPASSPAQIQGKQQAFRNQQERVRSVQSVGQKKNLLWIGLVLAVALIFFGGEKTKNVIRPGPEALQGTSLNERDLAAYLPEIEGNGPSKTVDMFFRAGFREYREGNYLRAKTSFETVLQIVPNHRLASLYLENSNKKIEEEISLHLEGGKRSMEVGKLRSARGHFEAILRLLYKDQSHPSYLEAKDQLEKVKHEIQDGGASS